jgi:hypothetical protein
LNVSAHKRDDPVLRIRAIGQILGAVLLCLFVLGGAAPVNAWPAAAYPRVFKSAGRFSPPALAAFLTDFEPVLSKPCGKATLEEATKTAISALSRKNGDLAAAAAAFRDAGCAAVALNDPGLDSLVSTYAGSFAVVYYGGHSALDRGSVADFVKSRSGEHAKLMARLKRASELPNRDNNVETSPEYGVASIAYSHAVTDVANVWLYIWKQSNGDTK